MSNPDYDFGISTKEWITLDGHNVGFFLSDNSQIWINADDQNAPSSWSVTITDEYGSVVEDLTADARIPVKAGAVEFARAAIRKRELETIPSPEQAARGWNQARPAERFNTSNGLTVIDPPGKRPEAVDIAPAMTVAEPPSLSADDALALARKLMQGSAYGEMQNPPPVAPVAPPVEVPPAFDPLEFARSLATPKPPEPSLSSGMPTDPLEFAKWLAEQSKG